MRRLAVLLVVEAAGVMGLIAATPVFVTAEGVDDPIATVLWGAALVLGAWLFLSTACSAAVEVVPHTPALLEAVVRRTTLPAVRAVVAGALAFGSTTLTAPIAVATDASPSTIRTGRDITVVEPEPPAAPATPPIPTSPWTGAATDHRVIPGDNLWTIAADHLASRLGTRPTEPEVARYWAVVVDVNRPRIRSGDPDLIFPGELIALPPL